MGVVRMKDIARDLGVSAVTVSKVLRNHPDIGHATRDRVLQRVKEMRYRPNVMARGLVTGRTFLIALVVPDLVHAFFAEIAVSVSNVLRKHGYTMLIAWTADDPALQLNEIEHLLSLGVDAMIIATSGNDTACFELLEDRQVPFVLLDRDVPGVKAPFVGTDDLQMGKLATQHLIDSGCKRIGHLTGPQLSPGRLRREGYIQALKEAGLPVRDAYMVALENAGPTSFHQGFEATQRLLVLTPRIDGIFCYNDPLAVGAIEAVLAAGLRIPQDIAVVGCSNHPLAAALRLPLSTMDQDTQALGEKSARLVLSMLAKPGKVSLSKRTVLPTKLIARASSQRSQPRSRRTAAGA